MNKTPLELLKEREEREAIKKVMSTLGKRSANKLTPQQRSERARKASISRWSKEQNTL